jgi:hypothetical protein
VCSQHTRARAQATLINHVLLVCTRGYLRPLWHPNTARGARHFSDLDTHTTLVFHYERTKRPSLQTQQPHSLRPIFWSPLQLEHSLEGSTQLVVSYLRSSAQLQSGYRSHTQTPCLVQLQTCSVRTPTRRRTCMRPHTCARTHTSCAHALAHTHTHARKQPHRTHMSALGSNLIPLAPFTVHLTGPIHRSRS